MENYSGTHPAKIIRSVEDEIMQACKEAYEEGYNDGYDDGHTAGYDEGLKDATAES